MTDRYSWKTVFNIDDLPVTRQEHEEMQALEDGELFLLARGLPPRGVTHNRYVISDYEGNFVGAYRSYNYAVKQARRRYKKFLKTFERRLLR